ncbi:MAG: alpha/beta fold hydrolase [bacterium]
MPLVATRTEQWATDDGDELVLHRLDAPSGVTPMPPRLLVLHGLEGTIHSHYVRGMLQQALRRGWAADVLIFRGCGPQMNRRPRMYHSGETSDLDFVVHRLLRENPHQPLVLAGFSLGGNVMLKWLGEQGSRLAAQVRAAAAISVPFDLEGGSRQVEHGFSRLYTRHFLRTLKVKARAKLRQFPSLFSETRLDQARTLYEFDDAVTAPMHGFESAHHYYSASSSLQYLPAVDRPTLLIASTDDPFLSARARDGVAMVSRVNEALAVELHSSGGHVGFVSGWNPFRARYYAEERAMEFLAGWI